MRFTRRQIVEGGLATGLLGLASPAGAALLQDPAQRRRPGMAGAQPTSAASPFRQPHPGQPLARPPAPVIAQRPTIPAQPRAQVDGIVNPLVVAAARASYDRHRSRLRHTETVGIVDFSKMSNQPRFYLLDTASGRVSQHHVAHGRGSDPEHTGLLQRFSNRVGSEATSEGAYLTDEFYNGRYGRSMRVQGLDWTNSNAYQRAIVVHSAWYAEPSMLSTHGLLGRSEGCFAMSYASLQETLGRLGPGRFLYATRT